MSLFNIFKRRREEKLALEKWKQRVEESLSSLTIEEDLKILDQALGSLRTSEGETEEYEREIDITSSSILMSLITIKYLKSVRNSLSDTRENQYPLTEKELEGLTGKLGEACALIKNPIYVEHIVQRVRELGQHLNPCGILSAGYQSKINKIKK